MRTGSAVWQLDNKLSIIREVSGKTVKIKERETGRNRQLNCNETLERCYYYVEFFFSFFHRDPISLCYALQ